MEYQFKKHPLHQQYLISNTGEVYSTVKNRPLKGLIKPGGYKAYHLNHRWYYAHRLVMETFSPHPDSANLEVNHMDSNPANNHYQNLQWCTHAQNMAYSAGRPRKRGADRKRNKPVGISYETRMKMGDAKRGANHPRFKGYFLDDCGHRYESLRDMVDALQTNGRKLTKWCREGINGFGFLPKEAA